MQRVQQYFQAGQLEVTGGYDMGLFKKKEKSGEKCPACGSLNTCAARGVQPVVAYPGFYSGVSADSSKVKADMRQCKECKNVFRIS
jgi:hypothetical protein